MKKIAIILFVAICLAACTKEDDTKWIDGTQWRYSYTESSGRKITCSLSLRQGGELTITDQYSSWQTEWSNRWEYRVKSYTYDGDKNGTIQLQDANAYSNDGTATFSLNYNNEKMYLSTPISSYTLERTR